MGIVLDILIHLNENLLRIYEAVDLPPIFNFSSSGKILFQNKVGFSRVRY